MKVLSKSAWPLLLVGILAGFVNGLLGAAGGIIVVLGLRLLYRKRVANGRSFYATAIAVMLPLSVLSAWQYAKGGHLPAVSLEAVIFPALIGGALGAYLLSRLSPHVLNRIFAAVVLVSGIMLAV